MFRVKFGNKNFSGLDLEKAVNLIDTVDVMQTPVHMEDMADVIKGIARHIKSDVRLLGRMAVREGIPVADKIALATDIIGHKYLSESCRMDGGESPSNCALCASRGGWPACGKSFHKTASAVVQTSDEAGQ